jgi:hypothetical protein
VRLDPKGPDLHLGDAGVGRQWRLISRERVGPIGALIDPRFDDRDLVGGEGSGWRHPRAELPAR